MMSEETDSASFASSAMLMRLAGSSASIAGPKNMVDPKFDKAPLIRVASAWTCGG
jgi:hypothetical protein